MNEQLKSIVRSVFKVVGGVFGYEFIQDPSFLDGLISIGTILGSMYGSYKSHKKN